MIDYVHCFAFDCKTNKETNDEHRRRNMSISEAPLLVPPNARRLPTRDSAANSLSVGRPSALQRDEPEERSLPYVRVFFFKFPGGTRGVRWNQTALDISGNPVTEERKLLLPPPESDSLTTVGRTDPNGAGENISACLQLVITVVYI